jgi:hypothetical protein
MKRYVNLCKHFSEVSENGSGSDTLYNLVIHGLNELKIKISAYQDSQEIQEQQQQPKSKNEEVISKQREVVLNPIAVKRRGHPPVLRKQSKFDIKRTRMKKQ